MDASGIALLPENVGQVLRPFLGSTKENLLRLISTPVHFRTREEGADCTC